ncbi:MAG: transglutaminase-like domain-containing protein [Planctomycetota bacterium]|nr:transglutaminase-like domain-containing protein [Planctomycetota bacterium]
MQAGILTLVIAALMVPPSGRPPIGPLQREQPKKYELRFEVLLETPIPRFGTEPLVYQLQNAPIVMPMIFHGAYSRINQDTIHGRLWLLQGEDRHANAGSQLKSGFAHHTHMYTMFVRDFRGSSLRWRVTYSLQSWASRIDERWASNLKWPQEWPEEVQDGLKPSQFIESDDPIFANSIQRLTNGNLRLAAPYLAAKEVVRYTISRFQVSGNGTDMGLINNIRGLNVKGALASWQNGLGTEHDLVCACVAMLRAAGIPARPVIGIEEQKKSDGKKRETFVSWVEFYLDGAGWVPFDPNVLRKQAIGNRNLNDSWKDFGTMDDLNERIPLSYFFIPPASVEAPWKPAVWGWDPRPGGDPSTYPTVNLMMISKGRGQDDPQ